MATAESKKSGKKLEAKAPRATSSAENRPRRRRWFRLAFWLPLVSFCALLALAPTLISWTPLGAWSVNHFVPLNGRIEIGSLSVGWFSPIVVSDITLRDSGGDAVATLAAASGDRSLLQLVLNHSDLGQLDLQQPTLHAVLHSSGSNLEDVLAPLLDGGSSSTAPTAVAVAVKVTGGSATVEDQSTGRKYQINDLAADVGWDSFSKEPLTAQGSAKLIDANRTADVSLSLKSQDSEAGGGTLGAGTLTCQIDRLPLDIVEPLLRRRLAGAQLAGSLSARLDCSWGGGPQHDEVSVEGQVDASDLLFTAAALGHDRIEMAKLTVPCQIVGTSKDVRIEKLLVDCDLGQLSLSGTVALADFAAGNTLAAMAHESCQLSGKLDLVRLAALLPDTLRIRPGTQVTAGELNVSLASQQAAAGQTDLIWNGRIETSDLEAVADGAQFKWQQPLSVDFQAHDGPGGPVVDKLNCDSSFLHVEGSGTPDQLTAGASFDLKQLAIELAQFVDLQGCQLTGAGQAQLTWQRDQDGHVQSQADLTARDFTLAVPNRPIWSEANLTLHLDCAGAMPAGTITHVDTLATRLEAGDERLSVQLLRPVDDPSNKPWPVQIDWQGELAGLLPRIEILSGLLGGAVSGWELAGSGNLQAVVQASSRELEVQQCRLSIQKLHAWGHGLYLDEPLAELTGTATWQRAAGKMNIPLASIQAASVVARLNNLELSQADKTGPQASGNATLEGDLAALRALAEGSARSADTKNSRSALRPG